MGYLIPTAPHLLTDLLLTPPPHVQFIWNTSEPSLTSNGGYVDVYLFRQDSNKVVTSFTHIPNEQGRVAFMPQDSWWQEDPAAHQLPEGRNKTWPFYFAITPAEQGLEGKEGSTISRLATWHAVQTARPALLAALPSTATSFPPSDAIMPSSILTTRPTAYSPSPTTSNSVNGTLNNPTSATERHHMPHWAIGLVTFFALLLLGLTIMRGYYLAQVRRRQHERKLAASRKRRAMRASLATASALVGIPVVGGAAAAQRSSSTTSDGERYGRPSTRNTAVLRSREASPAYRNFINSGHGDPSTTLLPDQAALVAQAYRSTLRQPPIAAGRFNVKQASSSPAPSSSRSASHRVPVPARSASLTALVESSAKTIDKKSTGVEEMSEISKRSASLDAGQALLKGELATEGKSPQNVGGMRTAEVVKDGRAESESATGAEGVEESGKSRDKDEEDEMATTGHDSQMAEVIRWDELVNKTKDEDKGKVEEAGTT